MSYAEAWLKWFDVIEGGAAPLSARMIELAGIDGACDVLDIGTGIGEPAVSAALAMGGGGHVLAVDRDPEMIAAGRQRAEVNGVSTIDFTVAKIETMALAPDSLDAVLARWSLMFVDDLKGVLTKLAGALRPGGHLAAAAWDVPGRVPALSLAKTTVLEHFGCPPPAYGPGTAFALSDMVDTEQTLAETGFDNVCSEIFPVAFEFASPAEYIQYRLDVAGPIWNGMAGEPAPVRRRAFAAIQAALQPYRTSNGSYRLVNNAYCLSGRRG